ncbi:MAG: thiamine ABC transporter substrate binding subunit [Rhodobacterales bacterium]
MKPHVLIAAFLTAGPALAQAPVLTVYTYDSFVSDWGPGPAIKQAFEAECNCILNLVGAGDGAALLGRLRLEGARSPADIVMGLDTGLIAAARETGLFVAHTIEADLDLPLTWTDPLFLPFDWGYFAFVGNRGAEQPASFRELAQSDFRIVIQDPRSSTPGLGLLMWVKSAYGDEAADIWEGLADNIVTVTPGWSEAYGLFLEGEADLVLSYTTSPAYHLIAEEDDSKVALPFTEGHYMQIEVAGILASSEQTELADQFLRFMISDAFQSVIPTTNWMYPVVRPDAGLPDGFSTLIQPEKAILAPIEQAEALRDAALAEWLRVLSR